MDDVLWSILGDLYSAAAFAALALAILFVVVVGVQLAGVGIQYLIERRRSCRRP